MADACASTVGDAPSWLPPGTAKGLVRPEETPSERGGVDARLPVPATPTLGELFANHPRDAGWSPFLLSLCDRTRPLLWIQERMAILEAGRIHPPGLGDLADIIHVAVRDTPALLWTMEEGLRCSGLGGVIGEAWGDHARLDFTATRRLAFAAERQGLPCWLVRLGAGRANLSGARWRWRLESLPSAPHPYDPRAPGPARLSVELFRARGRAPGNWEWQDEAGKTAHRLDLAPAPVDPAVGETLRRTG